MKKHLTPAKIQVLCGCEAFVLNSMVFVQCSTRTCLKIHSRHLHAPLRGILSPNSVSVAHYASFIGAQSPTKCDAQLTKSNFQTRSGIQNEKSGLRRLAFFTAIFLNVSFMRVAIVIMLYGPHVFWCRKTKLHM